MNLRTIIILLSIGIVGQMTAMDFRYQQAMERRAADPRTDEDKDAYEINLKEFIKRKRLYPLIESFFGYLNSVDLTKQSNLTVVDAALTQCCTVVRDAEIKVGEGYADEGWLLETLLQKQISSSVFPFSELLLDCLLKKRPGLMDKQLELFDHKGKSALLVAVDSNLFKEPVATVQALLNAAAETE